MGRKLFTDKFLNHAEEIGVDIPELLPQLLGFPFKTKIVFYPFITGKGFKDIRTVFEHTNEENEKLIKYYSKFITKGMSLMDKARQIAKEVNRRISYFRLWN